MAKEFVKCQKKLSKFSLGILALAILEIKSDVLLKTCDYGLITVPRAK